MDLHQNARSCPASRGAMVRRVLEQGRTVAEVAGDFAVSSRTVYRWVARFREQGVAGLEDRSSRPHRVYRRLPDDVIDRVRRLREARMSGAEIACRLSVPRSTVARWLQRLGLGRLRQLAPPEPIRRYQKDVPGELVHLDTKKLSKIDGVGHRIHGDRSRRRRGIGWEYTYVAIDDASRLSYVEMLSDERGETAARFLERAVRFFVQHGIPVRRVLTDNGSCFVSRSFTQLCLRLGIRYSRTRPYRPRTNGKAERFIQTLLREWAYAFTFSSSAARRTLLNTYLHFYNQHRAHSALKGNSPLAWLAVTNLVGINT